MIERKYVAGIALIAVAVLCGILLGDSAQPEGSADPYLVPETTAADHARASLVEFIVAGPGTAEGEAWRNATIAPGPVLFYDSGGRPFLYHFTVESDGAAIGALKIAARKVMGSSVMYYEVTPSCFNPGERIPEAIAVAEQRYPGSTVISALPCFSPPLTGVLVRIETADGGALSLLVDAASGAMVNEREMRSKRMPLW